MRLHRRERRTGTRAFAAALALGTAVAGLAACDEKDGGGSKTPVDKGIEKFDFDNAAFTDEQGEKQRFKDGHVTVKGYEDKKNDAGETVGWNIAEGPEFSDVDGDDDLDAAIVYKWVPAAGAPVYAGYLWIWDSGDAEQLTRPIEGGNYGAVRDLKARKRGFEVTTVSRPFRAPASEQDGEEETFTVGVEDGYPVQTKPALGAVDRCVVHDGDPPGARGDGTPPRVAPEADAPAIGEKADFEMIVTLPSETPVEGWELARATRTDGSVSCGWIRTSEAGQG